MTARGVAAPPPAAKTPTASQRDYVVQLGAYNNELYAINRVSQLKQMGLNNVFYRAFQKPDGQFINRVFAGTFTTMAHAQQASKLIQGNYQIAGIVSVLK
jgi:cell division septation protein DedD